MEKKSFLKAEYVVSRVHQENFSKFSNWTGACGTIEIVMPTKESWGEMV